MFSSARNRIIVAAMLVVGVGGAWISFDPKGLRRYHALGEEVASLESGNADLAAKLESLQKRAAALKRDPGALERPAREHGYVRPNEVLIELK